MRYEPALDGLRALAVTAVALRHAFPGHIVGGWVGVDVFFVLSGYLITRILAAEIEATGKIRIGRFYYRRFLRLAPALLAVIAFVLLVSPFRDVPYGDVARSALTAATYTMNWSTAFNWWPTDALGHTWSLAIEEQFYLLWPLTLLLIGIRHCIPWMVSALVAVVIWRFTLYWNGAPPDRIYMGFDTHADALLVGCILALARIPDWLRIWLTRAAPVLVLMCVAAVLFFENRTPFTLTVGYTLMALLSAALIVVALQPGWVNRALSFGPVVYVGRVSYGIYLWHWAILAIAIPFLPHRAFAIVPVIASYFVAAASYRWIEAPFLRLKDRMGSKQPAVAIQR